MKIKSGQIIGVYKPKGPTSHDIINQIRKLTGEKKVGHAGTLDPLASGVLVVGVGRQGTRQLKEYVGHEKEYVAKIKLGETSITDDSEGLGSRCHFLAKKRGLTPSASLVGRGIIKQDIEKITPDFIGEIMQVPPVFSATKMGGKVAHREARAGRKVVLGAGQVTIKEIEILKYKWPYLDLRVVTGSGAYIRSLARDMGEKLGVGGYLAELERTRVGEFTIKKSLKLKNTKTSSPSLPRRG